MRPLESKTQLRNVETKENEENQKKGKEPPLPEKEKKKAKDSQGRKLERTPANRHIRNWMFPANVITLIPLALQRLSRQIGTPSSYDSRCARQTVTGKAGKLVPQRKGDIS